MKNLLIQLDTDSQPSTFDRIVASDAGADEIFAYGGVTPDQVISLVHGAIFTRKISDLSHTALFIGGSDVEAGEAVYAKVLKTFFGPMRVSVMMDSNGSNTTAAAAILAAQNHLDLAQTRAIVLGGTGPVGCRAVQLLAGAGAEVVVASRSLEKASQVCQRLTETVKNAKLKPVAASSAQDYQTAAKGCQLILAAGAAGIEFLPESAWTALSGLQVAIDVNAVSPLGLGGIDVMDKAKERSGIICYGAIGVGGTKMKIHQACIKRLFEANDQALETKAIYEIGKAL